MPITASIGRNIILTAAKYVARWSRHAGRERLNAFSVSLSSRFGRASERLLPKPRVGRPDISAIVLPSSTQTTFSRFFFSFLAIGTALAEVAGYEVAGLDLTVFGRALRALLGCVGATGVEAASRGGICGGGNVARKVNAVHLDVGIGIGDRGE